MGTETGPNSSNVPDLRAEKKGIMPYVTRYG